MFITECDLAANIVLHVTLAAQVSPKWEHFYSNRKACRVNSHKCSVERVVIRKQDLVGLVSCPQVCVERRWFGCSGAIELPQDFVKLAALDFP